MRLTVLNIHSFVGTSTLVRSYSLSTGLGVVGKPSKERLTVRKNTVEVLKRFRRMENILSKVGQKKDSTGCKI